MLAKAKQAMAAVSEADEARDAKKSAAERMFMVATEKAKDTREFMA